MSENRIESGIDLEQLTELVLQAGRCIIRFDIDAARKIYDVIISICPPFHELRGTFAEMMPRQAAVMAYAVSFIGNDENDNDVNSRNKIVSLAFCTADEMRNQGDDWGAAELYRAILFINPFSLEAFNGLHRIHDRVSHEEFHKFDETIERHNIHKVSTDDAPSLCNIIMRSALAYVATCPDLIERMSTFIPNNERNYLISYLISSGLKARDSLLESYDCNQAFQAALSYQAAGNNDAAISIYRGISCVGLHPAVLTNLSTLVDIDEAFNLLNRALEIDAQFSPAIVAYRGRVAEYCISEARSLYKFYIIDAISTLREHEKFASKQGGLLMEKMSDETVVDGIQSIDSFADIFKTMLGKGAGIEKLISECVYKLIKTNDRMGALQYFYAISMCEYIDDLKVIGFDDGGVCSILLKSVKFFAREMQRNKADGHIKANLRWSTHLAWAQCHTVGRKKYGVDEGAPDKLLLDIVDKFALQTIWGCIRSGIEDGLPTLKGNNVNYIIMMGGIGDYSITLSLLDSFRKHHNNAVCIITDGRYGQVCELFRGCYDEMAIIPDGMPSYQLYSRISDISPGGIFTLDTTQRESAVLKRSWDLGERMLYSDIFKFLMAIPLGSPMVRSSVSVEIAEKARKRFESYGLPKGKTIIIVGTTGSMWHFSENIWDKIIRHLIYSGHCVVNNISETRNADTLTMYSHDSLFMKLPRVDFPMDEIAPFIELAGYCVATRTGVCDVLGLSRGCTVKLKILFHPTFSGRQFNQYSLKDFNQYSVKAMFGLENCDEYIINDDEDIDVASMFSNWPVTV